MINSALRTTVSSLHTNITESTSSTYFSRNLRTVPVKMSSLIPNILYVMLIPKKKKKKLKLERLSEITTVTAINFFQCAVI